MNHRYSNLYFFLLILILSACISKQETKDNSFGTIQFANGPIDMNGSGDEQAWESAEWHSLNHTWVGEEPTPEDFSGRFKLLWSEKKLYILAETRDDRFIDFHDDGLDRYWDDDCLELFIDEDNSDGNHQYNHNAFAYHISKSLRVTDIGLDSLPMYLDHHLQSAYATHDFVTTWEVAMDVYTDDYVFGAKPRMLKENDEIGFMVAYCDNDVSEEREHFVGSIAIEGKDKNRGWIDAGVFNNWILKK